MSVLLLQSGNPFVKKVDTSLVRLSADSEEEEEKAWLDGLQQFPGWALSCHPCGLLPCLAVDLALAKSLESLVHVFPLAALHA